ncbi:hypothetical protein ABZ746_02000 [Streptomyces sp. NPDC020096]
MSKIRTARALAALAALPLTAVLFAGTASADNGSFANDHSQANVNSTGQASSGAGATNQSNTASVNGSGDARIEQHNVRVNFSRCW